MHRPETSHDTSRETRPDAGPAAPGDSGRALPATMRSIVQEQFGDSGTLELRDDVAVPTPGKGEVLVEVAAAAVDRGTWHLMEGLPYAVRLAGFGVRRPKRTNPAIDLAGRVVAVGEGVTRLRVGDEVVGIGISSLARYAVARESKLAVRPAAVPAELAAAVPVSGTTAIQAVRDHARIQPGQRVLVLGASGGVGSWAVQLAKLAGAHVTGVASAAKLDHVRALGADEAVDYATTDPVDGSAVYDAIIDIGGNRPVRRLRSALTPTGTLVIVGGENGGRWTGGVGRQLRAALRSRFVSQRLTTFIAKESHEDIAELLAMIADGRLAVPIDRTVDLADAPAAIDDLSAGRVRGKAVVRIA